MRIPSVPLSAALALLASAQLATAADHGDAPLVSNDQGAAVATSRSPAFSQPWAGWPSPQEGIMPPVSRVQSIDLGVKPPVGLRPERGGPIRNPDKN